MLISIDKIKADLNNWIRNNIDNLEQVVFENYDEKYYIADGQIDTRLGNLSGDIQLNLFNMLLYTDITPMTEVILFVAIGDYAEVDGGYFMSTGFARMRYSEHFDLTDVELLYDPLYDFEDDTQYTQSFLPASTKGVFNEYNDQFTSISGFLQNIVSMKKILEDFNRLVDFYKTEGFSFEAVFPENPAFSVVDTVVHFHTFEGQWQSHFVLTISIDDSEAKTHLVDMRYNGDKSCYTFDFH